MLYHTNKHSNRKNHLHHPLLVPNHPWESISIEFVGDLLITRKGDDNLFVADDRFNKMCVLMILKRLIVGKKHQTSSLDKSRCAL